MRGTWDDVNRRLAGAFLGLDLGDMITVAEKRPEPRKRLFRKAEADRTPRRWVAVTATQSMLLGELVGAKEFGGEWEMDAETVTALTKLGWEKPWSPEYPTFQREVPLQGAPRLALASARALQVLGCEVADLDAELTHEEPDQGPGSGGLQLY